MIVIHFYTFAFSAKSERTAAEEETGTEERRLRLLQQRGI